jgi:hypothetical protein
MSGALSRWRIRAHLRDYSSSTSPTTKNQQLSERLSDCARAQDDYADRCACSIVIIHGLKGHAYKTWTSPLMPDAVADLPTDLRSDGEMIKSRREHVLRSVTSLMKRASGKRGPGNASKPKTPVPTLFWPRDLLPEDCPNARILTYGYDTKITKYTSGSTNKNSVFSHSKDFLFALGRSHTKDRPLIFLAHSLGGIVVKEVTP